jgi:hypothetical protein
MKYKREVRKVLLDALLFPHGILWHGYKGNFGMTDEQSLYVKYDHVFVKRICPTRFIFDPNVNMSTLDEASWVGRIIDIPYYENDIPLYDNDIYGVVQYDYKIEKSLAFYRVLECVTLIRIPVLT